MFYALVFMHLQVKNFLKLLLCKKWQISHMTMRRPKDSVASRREGEITFIYILRYSGRFKCLKPRFEKFCFEVGTFTNTYTDWSNFWGIRSNDPDSVIIMRKRFCVISKSFPSSFRVDRRLSSLLYFFDLILGRFPPRRRRQPFKYRWGHNFHAQPPIAIFKSWSDSSPTSLSVTQQLMFCTMWLRLWKTTSVILAATLSRRRGNCWSCHRLRWQRPVCCSTDISTRNLSWRITWSKLPWAASVWPVRLKNILADPEM